MNNTVNKQQTLEKLLVGVNTLVDVVKTTSGSKGHTILIQKDGKPYITKDGVTVAKSIYCEDPIENMGCQLIQQAAELTVLAAGDGTSKTSIMSQAIIKELINSKEDHRELFNQIEDATNSVLKELKKQRRKIKSLRDCIKVATISTNSEHLGQLIGQVMWDAKENGVVFFELSDNGETYIYQEDGSRYEKMYDLKEFLGATGTKVSYDNPVVLNLSEDLVHLTPDITDIFEMAKSENRATVIIAPNYSKLVLDLLLANHIKKGFKILPLYNPGYGEEKLELYKDINSLILHDNVKSILATKQDFTLITKGVTPSLQERINVLSHQATVENRQYYKEKIEKRLSILSQKIFTIYAGATSELEQDELRDRMEDGILATRAAINEGYVLGGGLAFRNIARQMNPKTEGERILQKVICTPYAQILYNANINNVDMHSYEDNFGINTTTLKVEDFLKSGIIDPYKVEVEALKNSVSVAKTIISLNGCVLSNETKVLKESIH